VRAAVAVCLLLVVGTARAADGPTLLLPGGKEPFALRLDLTVDGKPPEAAWEAFLDGLFDYFDRDGDGVLSRAETGRVFPLPLPGRRELTLDFDKLAGRDGKVTRERLKEFCRGGGFTPLVVNVEPPSADDVRLGEVLFRRLDADGDGKLTKDELRRASARLRKFDLSEDDVLEPAELLAFAGPAPAAAEPRTKWAAVEGDAVLRLEFGKDRPAPQLAGAGKERLRLTTPARDLARLHGPDRRWLATFRPELAGPDVRGAGEFLLAQFLGGLGDRPSLAKADLEQDSNLAGLMDLFPYADRDGDGRLTRAELERYLALVELGVRAQTWVTASERGPSLFHLLDADGDGRLGPREVNRAADLLGEDVAADALPWQVRLTFGGPAASSLGGVPLPAAKKPRPAANAPRGPRWFRAMDRNGDGVVTPDEFVGPPELFRTLDADGDGVISPEEAEKAGDR
jgi:Ca2+-binding EF-hand superfamily protein